MITKVWGLGMRKLDRKIGNFFNQSWPIAKYQFHNPAEQQTQDNQVEKSRDLDSIFSLLFTHTYIFKQSAYSDIYWRGLWAQLLNMWTFYVTVSARRFLRSKLIQFNSNRTCCIFEMIRNWFILWMMQTYLITSLLWFLSTLRKLNQLFGDDILFIFPPHSTHMPDKKTFSPSYIARSLKNSRRRCRWVENNSAALARRV